jgi:hypothetical protein
MVASLDVVVATTLADTVRRFKVITSGAANGLEFEQTLFQAVLNAHHWRYATPPDKYDFLSEQTHTFDGNTYADPLRRHHASRGILAHDRMSWRSGGEPVGNWTGNFIEVTHNLIMEASQSRPGLASWA